MKSLKDIDAVILCGGLGTRLHAVIADRPKTLAEINGRPFLDILLTHLSSFGLRRFVLCTGHMSDAIESLYRNRKNIEGEIIFSRERSPLGTAGAIKNAEKLISSDSFIVLNGDSFCPVDYRSLFDFHLKKKARISIVVVDAQAAQDYGAILLDDLQRIIKFQEKSVKGATYINAGIYLCEEDILSMIPINTKFSFEYDLFPQIVGRELYGFISPSRFIDIGTPERLALARSIFLNNA